MEEKIKKITPELDSFQITNSDSWQMRKSSSLEDVQSIGSSNGSFTSDGKTHRRKPKEAKCKKQIQELNNYLQVLKNEIFKYLNQNLTLKKHFLLAKNAVKREIGVDVGCMDELVKRREEEGWSGSEDVIVALRKKLYYLKTLVREKREELAEKVMKSCSTSSFNFDSSLSEDERMQDLLCKERESMIQNIRREEQKWIEDRDILTKKLEILKERNEEAEKEVSSLRSDLKNELELPKVLSEPRFLEVQKKMEMCLEKKFKLNNLILSIEINNKTNKAEIEELKEEAERQNALHEASEEALKVLGCKREEQDILVHDTNLERKTTSKKFREDLDVIFKSYSTHLENLDSVVDVDSRSSHSDKTQQIVPSRHESNLLVEIRKRRGLKGDAIESTDTEKECRDATKTIPSEVDDGIEGKELMTFTRISPMPASNLFAPEETGQQVHLIQCLENELLELSSIMSSEKKKLRERYSHLHAVFDHMKAKLNQLLDTTSQYSKESVRVFMLSDRLKKQQKGERSKEERYRDKFRYSDTMEVEDSEVLLQVLQSENQCIKQLIQNVCDTIDEDIDKFLQLCTIKIFF